jgi:hypothetical protein
MPLAPVRSAGDRPTLPLERSRTPPRSIRGLFGAHGTPSERGAGLPGAAAATGRPMVHAARHAQPRHHDLNARQRAPHRHPTVGRAVHADASGPAHSADDRPTLASKRSRTPLRSIRGSIRRARHALRARRWGVPGAPPAMGRAICAHCGTSQAAAYPIQRNPKALRERGLLLLIGLAFVGVLLGTSRFDRAWPASGGRLNANQGPALHA